VGHPDAIIKDTKWNSIAHTFFSELLRKKSEVYCAEAILEGIAYSFRFD